MTLKNSEIKSITRINEETVFKLGWFVTTWCNYRCPYCLQKHDKAAWIPEETIMKMADKLNELIIQNSIRNIELKLIGGEVTYYNIPKILDRLSNIKKLILVTNFSRDLEYFKDLYKYCYDRHIAVLLICSKHDANKHFDEKLIEFTKWCIDNHYSMPQLSMVVDNDFDYSVVDYFKSNGVTNIKLVLMKISNSLNTVLSEENAKKLEFYSKKPNTSATFRIVKFDGTEVYLSGNADITNQLDKQGFIPQGFKCNAGKHTLYVRPDGNVYKICCKYLSTNEETSNEKRIGNLLLDDVILINNAEDIECKLLDEVPHARCTLCNGNSVYRI